MGIFSAINNHTVIDYQVPEVVKNIRNIRLVRKCLFVLQNAIYNGCRQLCALIVHHVPFLRCYSFCIFGINWQTTWTTNNGSVVSVLDCEAGNSELYSGSNMSNAGLV